MPDSVESLSVAEAQHMILAQLEVLPAEDVSLIESLGRVLATEVVAQVDLPPFDNSAMDGYAVRSHDWIGVKLPITLQVIADLPAGTATQVSLAARQAARIMTGAMLPGGADAVVPIEWTGETRAQQPLAKQIQVSREIQPGCHVRRAGEDVRRGQVVLQPGQVIQPRDIALLAALGCEQVAVIRRPRVALLSTGDELVAAGQVPRAGQIRDVNTPSLQASIIQSGAVPLPLGIAPDEAAALRARLELGLQASPDVLLVSGGVSVGTYDLVKDVIETDGQLTFWKVRMRPGKPLALGRLKGVLIVGLPGNPVSAMLTFAQFVRPALLKMAGRTSLSRPVVMVHLQDALSSDGRETFVGSRVERQGERYVAFSSGPPGSAMLSTLQRANALVIIPEGQREARPGSTLPAQMLDWPEGMF